MSGHREGEGGASGASQSPATAVGSPLFVILPGERHLVGYLAALFLVVGLGLVVGRSSADALFFKRFGVEFLPWMFVVTGGGLAAGSAFYARWVNRVPTQRMLEMLIVAIAAGVTVTWGAMTGLGGRWTYALYFVLCGVVSELALIHLNLYAAGFFDALSAKRLFPAIMILSRVGAVIGGVTVGVLAKHVPVANFALLWIVSLLMALGLVTLRHRGARRSSRQPLRPPPLYKVAEGWRYARCSRLLRLSAIAAFVLILVVCIQDFVASTVITRHFTDEGTLTAFFGWFFALTNAAALATQMFLTDRLIRRHGPTAANLIFPATSLFSFVILAFSPSFFAAAVARLNYTGVLPAFRNPAADLFFKVLPEHMQERGRALMTGIVLPSGLVCGGLLLLALPRHHLFPAALAGLGLSCALLFLKMRKNRAYEESLLGRVDEMVFTRNHAGVEDFGRIGDYAAKHLAERLSNADADEAATIVDILARGAPDLAFALVSVRCAALPAPIRDRLLLHMANVGFPHWQTIARENLRDGDLHLRATALKLLIAHGDAAARLQAVDWLGNVSPRLRGEAAGALLAHADGEGRGRALETLEKMLASGDHSSRVSALFAAAEGGDVSLFAAVHAHLRAPETRARVGALRAVCALSASAGRDCGSAAAVGLDDPTVEVRVAAVRGAVHIVDDLDRSRILARALANDSFAVRRAVREIAIQLAPRTADGWRVAFTAYAGDFDTLAALVPGLAASTLDEREALLTELAQRHLDRARELRANRTELTVAARPQPSRQAAFLGRVIEEEVARNLSVVFAALEALDESAAVPIIRAGLGSFDRKLRARALESARTVRDHAFMRALVETLEGEFEPAPPSRTASRTVHNIATWAKGHGSAWLGECATACLATGGGEQ